MLRTLFLRLLNLTPRGLRQWVYRHPRALGPLARLVKRAVPTGGAFVTTFRLGPNRGLKWAVDRTTPNYYWLSPYEGEVEQALRDRVRPGMVVADVGAHIGYDTLMFSRWVGPAGLVLSFEPDPENLLRLRRNCALNQLPNVRVIPSAVSDSAGPVRFRAEGKTTGHVLPATRDGSLKAGATTAAPAAMAGVESITVEGVTLDEVAFAEGLARLDVVKIDVEGHEAQVLAGARRVLAELRPVLLIEAHGAAAYDACRRLLVAAGYTLRPLATGAEGAAPDGVSPGEVRPGENPREGAAGGGGDGHFRIVHVLALPADPAAPGVSREGGPT